MTEDGDDDGDVEDASEGATEPITLTDPDGSVTRVAPWSSWTREQVRAPGGEPALVTRLDEGQLWFAAGRRRSPWRHEVVAGPATVTTPRGRFQVIAEADGGATIVCLAGRARVVTGLRQPVLLGPNQTASVSSDGSTLIVSDAPTPEDDDSTTVEVDQSAARLAMTHDQDDDPTDYFHEEDEPVVPLPAVAGGSTALEGPVDVDVADDREEPIWPWLPEIVAVAAILAVLFAAFVVFTRPSEVDPIVAPAASTSSTTTLVTTTSTSLATTTTTTAPPETTITPPPPPPAAPAVPATATGVLQTCRRAEGGVSATVAVTHESGGPSRFDVRVGLFDPPDQMFAQGEGRSATIEPGATVSVEVLVAFAGTPRGACEVLGVEPA